MEWFGAKLGPYYARKKNVTLSRNQKVTTWEGHEVAIDLYTPRGPRPAQGWPVAIMIHGGGWRFFSKDSHALVAAQIAEMGFFTIATDYRLAPKYPYPHGLIDVLSVYDWMHTQAQDLHLDLKNIVLAGESAGASFALGISMLASGIATPKDLLHSGFESKKLDWSIPKKVIIHCGYHQVSNVARYDGKISTLVRCRIRMIQKNYLPQSLKGDTRPHWGLADPLCILEDLAEQGIKMTGTFPEVFIPVGERDPVLDDSVRLAKVLERLGQKPKLKIYPGAPHSFYAMPWNNQYANCWKDIEEFLSVSN